MKHLQSAPPHNICKHSWSRSKGLYARMSHSAEKPHTKIQHNHFKNNIFKHHPAISDAKEITAYRISDNPHHVRCVWLYRLPNQPIDCGSFIGKTGKCCWYRFIYVRVQNQWLFHLFVLHDQGYLVSRVLGRRPRNTLQKHIVFFLVRPKCRSSPVKAAARRTSERIVPRRPSTSAEALTYKGFKDTISF